MKTFIIAIICLPALVASAGQIATGPVQQSATANQQSSTWERDRWQPDKRFNEIDPKTRFKTGGFVERDKWEPKTRWNVYDQNGKFRGILEQDQYDSGRWNYASGVGEYDDGIGGYDDGIGN